MASACLTTLAYPLSNSLARPSALQRTVLPGPGDGIWWRGFTDRSANQHAVLDG